MYSVTSRSSFDQLRTYFETVQDVKRQKFKSLSNLKSVMHAQEPSQPVFVIVGNKADMTDEREVSTEDGSDLAHKLGCGFIEISATNTEHIDPLFVALVRALRHDQISVRLVRRKKSRNCIVM
jgi:GTPase KRas protein